MHVPQWAHRSRCECKGRRVDVCGHSVWMGHRLSWASAPTGEGTVLSPHRPEGVGGRVAEALVSMVTAGSRMLLALVLVQMGWEQGVGIPQGRLNPPMAPSVSARL